MANIILHVLSAGRNLGSLAKKDKRQEGRSERKDRLKTVCG